MFRAGLRYYAPWLARWTSADPIGIGGGSNLYLYAAGNPVMLVDPSGTDPDPFVNLPRDENGVIYVGNEVIEVVGQEPAMDPYEKARRAGTTDIVSRDEFERQRSWELRQSTAYKTWWTDESAAAYWAEFPEEAANEYDGQLEKDYKSYRSRKDAELASDWRRIDSAAGLIKVIGGATIVVASGFGIAAAVGGGGTLIGGGLELGGGGGGATATATATTATTATTTAGLLSTSAQLTAGQLGQAAGVAGGGGAIINELEEAAPSAEVTVYRFCDVLNSQTMTSNASLVSEETAAQGAQILENPAARELLGDLHATNMIANLNPSVASPFVSVGEKLTALVNSPDPILQTIVARAPHVGIFQVPANLLYQPVNPLSLQETELLFFGSDLGRFLTAAFPNPWLGGD